MMNQLCEAVEKLEEWLSAIDLDVRYLWRNGMGKNIKFQKIVENNLRKILSGDLTFIEPATYTAFDKWLDQEKISD